MGRGCDSEMGGSGDEDEPGRGRWGRSGSWVTPTALTWYSGLAPGFSAAAGSPPRASRERRAVREGGSGCAAFAVLPVTSPSEACPPPRWQRRWQCLALSAGRAGGSCSCGACPVRGQPTRGAGWSGGRARGRPGPGAGRKRPWWRLASKVR